MNTKVKSISDKKDNAQQVRININRVSLEGALYRKPSATHAKQTIWFRNSLLKGY